MLSKVLLWLLFESNRIGFGEIKEVELESLEIEGYCIRFCNFNIYYIYINYILNLSK